MSERVVNPVSKVSRGKRRFRYFSEGPIEDLGPVDAERGERADDQATTRTAGQSTDDFQVSADMRAMVEKSLEQARQAFDGFIGAAQRAVDMFGETAGKGAKDIAEKAVTFAEEDMAISFDFARQLVRARSVQDVLKLQTEYVNAQVQLFSEHARTDPARARRNDTS
jgi:phasin